MPKGHKPLGIGSSTMSTKSPTSTLGFTWNHFCQDCKSGKYSRVHLFQNWVAMYCTYRHRFRYTSAVSKFPHGNEATPSIANRWFGVKTSQSLTSSLDFVIGRPLMMHSHSQSTVWRTSSVSVMWWRNSANSILQILHMSLFHTPPWWESRGVLNSQSTHLRFAAELTLALSSWRRHRAISACAPTKFVQLSL